MSTARGLAVASVVAIVALASCKRTAATPEGPGGPDAGGFDKPALLRAFGECALGAYRDVQSAAVELDAAARRAETEGTPEAKTGAQEAWKKTIDAWQRAELFGFGPAAMTGSPGGQDLRDPIYAWPLSSRCLVEQQLVDKVYEKPELATTLVSTRGLGALEYLLFYAGADNACPTTASINAAGAWTALGDAEIGKRKASYARALSSDVLGRIQRLVDAWEPGKGNFLAELAGAGSTKTFATQQLAFNAVSDATFYVDDVMKNMKVGRPAGLYDCTAASCLEFVESAWAKRSKEHLSNNLSGFERLVLGCGASGAGLGFDDYLSAVGAEATATKLTAQLAAARAALTALTEPTFEQDIQKNPAGVQALFDALRAIVATLKSEVVSVLDLEIPKRVEGDND
jgi:uncharacterized protein